MILPHKRGGEEAITIVAPPSDTSGIEGYTTRELRRVLGVPVRTPALPGGTSAAIDEVILGTPESNPALLPLLRDGWLAEPGEAQGYSLRRDIRGGRRVLAICGTDAAGALYALRDLEHYCLDELAKGMPVIRADYPRIAYRGHWTWGCNMPDKKAWIENMSRWKLNELIHWDNHPPARAKEYVEFAHERGVRMAWGFGWGWVPAWNYTLPPDFDHGVGEGVEMCGSSEANRAFFRREILRKVREDYAPTGCDGIYFQAFTECPKCQCPRCQERTMGELMLHFVNPIVDDIAREFPDLWISCGIHHDFGDFSYLKELDPRCNILWENCAAGVSVRGKDEDFGYIYKSIPYSHGYGAECPADPPYSEAALREWMASNADRYIIDGGLQRHCQYMAYLQNWGRRFLGKRSRDKHASVVADHAVFCRRTPFPHVALAEAQWNPERDTAAAVDGILAFLGMTDAVLRTTDPDTPLRDPAGKPPWLCHWEEERERESHAR